MTEHMRWNWLLAGLAVLLLLIVAFAWVAGGREPVREITRPIAVPERTL